MRLNAEQRAQALEVARAHGTTVAARWAGVATATMVQLRKRVDGYDRGRGHPTLEETRAMAVRDDCQCPRCRAHRGVTVPALTPAQQAMVEANTGLVGFVLRRRRCPPEMWDDQFQDGLIGLMRAAQLFDPSKGYRFSTYAVGWIRAGLQKGERNFQGRSYRVAQDGRGTWQAPLSLDASLSEGDLEEITLGDAVLVDDRDPADDVIRDLDQSLIMRATLAACRDDLDRAVMIAVAAGTSLSEVARRNSVSHQTARVRLGSVRARMRHPVMRKRLGIDKLAA